MKNYQAIPPTAIRIFPGKASDIKSGRSIDACSLSLAIAEAAIVKHSELGQTRTSPPDLNSGGRSQSSAF
ncbi:hypothetical protein [Microcoleus sp. F4-D5]|uniref:hypothetical protein n=1 Tax=Microcoleus sp. F4-D5 TaxID=2818760 RepID=UPI002FD5F346